jgi:DNA-binding transcriptional MerR regulator
MSNLTKITDVSSRYDVTARTLRYYEDMGLLSSHRSDDYAYRMYDAEATARLEQILILRKLKISIKDIRRIFNAGGSEIVLEVLGKKVDDIDDEVSLLHELKQIILEFIEQIEQADFANDGDVKKLYERARDIQTQIVTGNQAPAQRLAEVSEKLTDLPNVMVVRIPAFLAVISEEGNPHRMESFWEWGGKNSHLLRPIVWDNAEFYAEIPDECMSGKFIYAIADHATAADTAPYETIDIKGGLYATAVCADMDDESIDSLHRGIAKWMEGTNFTADPDRHCLGHMLFPDSEIKRGLGYQQLQRYIPIKFNTDDWETVYSMSEDKKILAMEIGHVNGGFSTHALACTGNPTYTFNTESTSILVEKRANDWDGVNVKLKELALPVNHYCTLEVTGRVTGKLKNKGCIELTELPGYANMDSHYIPNGAEFKLTHTLPIMKDKDVPTARISSNPGAKTVPFIINSVTVSLKPFDSAPNYKEAERPKYEVVDLPDGKFVRTAMPAGYDSPEAFRKDILENYLPDWKHGGIGFTPTNETHFEDDVLFIRITQSE